VRIAVACVRYPPAPGGAEAHAAAVARGLAARGHEVRVHTTDLRTETPFERAFEWPAPKDGVRVTRHPARTAGGALHYVVAPALARGLLADASWADVVHVHSYGYFHTLVAALARKTKGVPLAMTPHFHPAWSMEGPPERRRLRAVFDATLGRASLAAADRVIAVSAGERDALFARFPTARAKSIVIPNGLDRARWLDAPPADGAAFRAARGIPKEAPLVLFSGRLASNKGLDVLLEAFARLVSSEAGAGDRREARLVVAGDPQARGAWLASEIRRRGLESRVFVTGHLPFAEYRAAFAACDVFALASEWEAFGIVLLEANASGKPVVATRVGGVPDVVEDGVTGFLVPHGDAAALAQRLGDVLGDRTLARRMGEAGAKRVEARFTWDRVVEATESVFLDLVKRRR